MKNSWILEYHFVRGDYSFCKRILKDFLKDSSGEQHEYSNYFQARIYFAEGKLQEGLQIFQTCYTQNPSNSAYLVDIAKCLIAQRRYKKASEALTHAKGLSKQPDFLLLYDLARCYANLKEYGLAEEICKESIQVCKSKPAYKLLATCLIQQKKIGEAIEVFRLALRQFPRSSQLYTTFGKLCSRMNFHDDALKTLTVAIKLKESNMGALSELASLHQKKEEYDEAIKLYHEVLNHEEGSAVIYNNLGLCYFYKDKFVLALSSLLKARDIDPLFPETFFNLGLIFSSFHQYCSAVVHWKVTTRCIMRTEYVLEQEVTALTTSCINAKMV